MSYLTLTLTPKPNPNPNLDCAWQLSGERKRKTKLQLVQNRYSASLCVCDWWKLLMKNMMVGPIFAIYCNDLFNNEASCRTITCVWKYQVCILSIPPSVCTKKVFELNSDQVWTHPDTLFSPITRPKKRNRPQNGMPLFLVSVPYPKPTVIKQSVLFLFACISSYILTEEEGKIALVAEQAAKMVSLGTHIVPVPKWPLFLYVFASSQSVFKCVSLTILIWMQPNRVCHPLLLLFWRASLLDKEAAAENEVDDMSDNEDDDETTKVWMQYRLNGRFVICYVGF